MRIRNLTRPWLILGAALLVGVLLAGVAIAQTAKPSKPPKQSNNQFTMVRSQSAMKAGKNCLKGVSANVRVTDAGQGNQNLYVTLNKAAPNTEFTVFVIQVPNSPFGVSWYQGDIATDNQGNGKHNFVGIFNDEVFAISPGAAKPANPHGKKDAKKGVKFAPIHTYHIGVWFADPNDARKAGCTNVKTPFDGDHVAGIQALSTRNSGLQAADGPLFDIKL
jgi:hypothetical protein